jgi:hypothetical protein
MSQPAQDFPYFACGSNMSSRRLTAPGRAPSAKRVTVGYVPGRRLRFDKFSTRDQSGKCDCEAAGDLARISWPAQNDESKSGDPASLAVLREMIAIPLRPRYQCIDKPGDKLQTAFEHVREA